MRTLPRALAGVSRAFEGLIFDGPLRDHLAHHLAHVAPEGWLALEFAKLVNERAGELGLPGWAALLERRKVDVTLVPPGSDPLEPAPPGAVYIELKLVGTDWWNTNWRDVRRDLADNRLGKPRANLAVCLLVHALSRSPGTRRRETAGRYEAFLARIPDEPAEFEPVPGTPRLHLLGTSPGRELHWPRPVFGRWPEGFRASVRLLWVQEAGSPPFSL